MDKTELLEMARRCIDDGHPVYALAQALARERRQHIGEVMFGTCHDTHKVRGLLKDAEFAALYRKE